MQTICARHTRQSRRHLCNPILVRINHRHTTPAISSINQCLIVLDRAVNKHKIPTLLDVSCIQRSLSRVITISQHIDIRRSQTARYY